MEDVETVKVDALERVDTESVLNYDTVLERKPLRSNVASFLKRYSAVLVILTAVLLFTVTFAAIALSSGRSAIRKNKELLSVEFEKLQFDNFVTIKGERQEDFPRLVAEVLYKVAVEFDPKEEALIYVHFNDFNKHHDRKHNNYRHKKASYNNFRNNLNDINEHNSKPNMSYTKSMNHFGDVSPKDFMKKYTKKVILNLPKDHVSPYNNNRPMSVDLRNHGVMTPVKCQGENELSWPYSAVAVAESFVKKTSQKTVSLSEKQLVECVTDKKSVNNPFLGYKYLKDLGLFQSEVIDKSPSKCPAMEGERFKVPSYSYSYEPDLVALLLNAGPLTVPVSVSPEWQFYADGTLNVCGAELNHYLTLVGVSFDEKGNHWILKNSYGEDWGKKGYLLLTRNSKEYADDCGLTSFAVYAV
ncbi:cysteine proteinase, putative [Theileria annulata]|uniref:Cysteine proteinase, putative n=1 Tax=Theileria annulata TaxID=5874 RepID=Q4UDK0_THEAN|nr:cysteine proteinase, putative [Theileria annulata]CAI74839.1 cysteine proteinase, putative [Theileria annulata]|eukprot:XP_952571.1 cysteine proteinase, putative [Theileria annulata]